ncbi:MAG TPA: hypothetical protein DCS18_12955 [Alcanivorax sp.]|jgi:hypothetical protein|nr:hypothetical protein [Alcanivorax sp.]
MDDRVPPRRQGEQDYRREPSVYRNPYSNGSDEFNEYERGYFQAQRRDPNPPARTTGRPVIKREPLGSSPRAPADLPKAPEPSPAAQRYRKRRDPD